MDTDSKVTDDYTLTSYCQLQWYIDYGNIGIKRHSHIHVLWRVDTLYVHKAVENENYYWGERWKWRVCSIAVLLGLCSCPDLLTAVVSTDVITFVDIRQSISGAKTVIITSKKVTQFRCLHATNILKWFLLSRVTLLTLKITTARRAWYSQGSGANDLQT